MRRGRYLFVWLIASTVASLGTWGAELVVSPDASGAYRSIQRAVDAARRGDMILIGPGVYEEVITLRSGITLRGSGPTQTILRSSYGYEPVIRGSDVHAVVVEGMTIERSPSILEAAVIELASSDVLLRGCRISGGRLGGIRVTGASFIVLEHCVLESNPGGGLLASHGAEIRVQDSRMAGNGLWGVHLIDAIVQMERTRIERNAWGGIVAEGTAALCAQGVQLDQNGRWGLRMTGSATGSMTDCSFSGHEHGSVQAEDAAVLRAERCSLLGGSVSGLRMWGASTLHAVGLHVKHVGGDGVRVEGRSEVHIEQSFVVRCEGNGLVVEGDGRLLLDQSTVAYNGGDAIRFSGSHLQVGHTILALNGGTGIKTSAAHGRGIDLSFNNVWGNRGGDYVGVGRPTTDLAVPPEFRDPGSGDLTLSPDSACIDGGAHGRMIGAGSNPQWKSTVGMDLSFGRRETAWGEWRAGIGWDAVSRSIRDARMEWAMAYGDVQWAISSTLWGAQRLKTQGTLRYRPSDLLPLAGWTVDPTVMVGGVLDGAASRWYAEGVAKAHGGRSSAEISVRFDGGTGRSMQAVCVSFGQINLWGSAEGSMISGLGAGWAAEGAWVAGDGMLGISLQIVPQLLLETKARWTREGASIGLEARTYLTQWTTGQGSLLWSTQRVSGTLDLQVRNGQFENLDARVSTGVGALALWGSLGASAESGPRIRVGIEALLDPWFVRPVNAPPVPVASHAPDDPEAGETVRFCATDSYDPDGEIDQLWWDFGDGNAAIGRVVEHQYAEEGVFEYTLTISDDDGATASLVQSLVIHPANTRPSASFVWAPVSAGGTRLQRAARAGDRILLDASSSRDPRGKVLEYQWDFQSDGVFSRTTSDPRIIIDPFTVGTWPVTLRVINAEGYSDAVMRVMTIEPLRPPQAQFDLSPSRPAVGDPVRFIDRSIAVDGHLISWEWSFGDGRTSREREPLHRYQSPGDHEIRLTVRDSEGLFHTMSVSISVQVNPELVQIQGVWALLMGISSYEEVEGLDYARRDAEAMAEWLVENGVSVENIRLLTDEEGVFTTSEGIALPMYPATLRNVREGLGWLRAMAAPDDLVIIHFSGHGYQAPSTGFDEIDGMDEFFVLHDTRASAKEDTALRDKEFGRFVDRMASNHVLIFFDSCYSGGLARSLPSDVQITGALTGAFDDLRLEGRLVLSASTEDQEAFESHALEHGVFSYFVIHGLRGAADLNGDGHITVWELYEYVRQHVPPFVAAERGRVQVPQLIGAGETRVVLGRALPEEAPPFTYCPPVPHVGGTLYFRAETPYALDEEAFSWTFGDGNTSVGALVSHAYDAPGHYLVTHEVVGPDGIARTSRLSVDVVAAKVSAVMEPDDRVLISVGRQHGVQVADQFALAESPGTMNGRPVLRAVLEVVELVDEDSAVCRVVSEWEDVTTGTELVPILQHRDAPCFPDPAGSRAGGV